MRHSVPEQTVSKPSGKKVPGKKRAFLKGTNAAGVLEMVFCLLTLPMAFNYLAGELIAVNSTRELRILLCALFFFMTVTRLFRSRRFRLSGKPGPQYVTQRIYAVVFLVCSFLPVFFRYTNPIGIQSPETYRGYSADVRQLVALLFWAAMFTGRVIAVVHNHQWRSLVLNIILMAFFAYMGLTGFIASDLLVACILIILQTLAAIFGFVFARIRVDVLRKIIRKTYASEIVLGLLLLICAFSYVFRFTEPSIPTFQDGLWYCFAIVTTIGFGDFTVTSHLGRALSVILGIYGIIVVALITSIIVNFYGEMKKDNINDENEYETEPESEPESETEKETGPKSENTP